jgi:hypothetical protein
MKKLINLSGLLLFSVALIFLYGCDERIDDRAMGLAEFSISLNEAGITKSDPAADTTNAAYHLMVSVEDRTGREIFSDKLIPIYIFGTGFVSEKVEIPVGEFRLTKFMIMNTSGSVLFAAPMAGSELAYLTKNPLPISFTVRSEQVTRVAPEVLSVQGYTPSQFGYVSFGMQVVRPLTFYTAVVPGYPTITSTAIQYLQAKLTVYDTRGWHYSFRLEAAVNRIVIRGGSDTYVLVVEKEGFMPLKIQVPALRLRETTFENPLILRLPGDTSVLHRLVLQPGPEEGKDAMISNLEADRNFGNHPFFEATFLSEPVLTVMRSNRSLIFFNLGSLPKSATIKRVVLRLSAEQQIIWPNPVPVTVAPGTKRWYGVVLQQVIESWDEYKVTWNNQPSTITVNQVYIPPIISNLNFIDVDVTRLFINNIDAANHGMLFRHYPTEQFPGFRFASGDHPKPELRPRLTIYYTLP